MTDHDDSASRDFGIELDPILHDEDLHGEGHGAPRTPQATRERERRLGRRALVQWTLATGAALGLPRWKVFEVLEATAGRALADDAACVPCNRSVHIIAGNGGFAWFQLLWPHNDVAAAGNDSFGWHAPGAARLAEGTHRPLTFGPETPWQHLPGARQVTALLGGTNQTHTRTPDSNVSVAMNTDLFAACASIQTASPTLTPVIGIGDAPYRNAPGAPRIARVGSANDIVALFNSAASRAGGLLATERNADLFQAHYSAWLSLRSAAGSPTWRSGMAAGTTSARLLGTNLADALRITDADLAHYGVSGTSRTQNVEFARALIVTAKAFRLGLTNSVIFPAMNDDPHGAFNDMGRLRRTTAELGRSLEAFLEDLSGSPDPSCSGTLADNTVLSIHGDTPKTPLNRANWPDGTPGNSNWVYVLSAGLLKSGWFGGVQRDGSVRGWDPTSGEDRGDRNSASTSSAAAASVLYAVAKGDLRRVQDFYRGQALTGVVTNPTI
ncbi:MAG: hypothetical protein KF901_05505 [Myxococcales bacterium]|nr:hypothetical protein [Myxococcales bacterium]